MKTSNKLLAAYMLLKAKLLKRRFPIIVSWSLTYRCNYRCKYCGIWNNKSEELNTKQIFSLIDEMAQIRTQRIHFTGGEPLLRDDIEVILSYCKKKGIGAALNSNGSLVSKRIEGLANLDLLSLSLDGPEEIHDAIRGKDSYREVMDAIELARQKNIKVRFITVLSRLNLNTIDFILNKAKELKTVVVFQPATRLLLEGKSINSLAPFGKEYSQVIAKLIREKRKNRYIGNSISGLRHLYNWPRPTKLPCVNSLIVCRIEPDGSLYGCGDNKRKDHTVNCAGLGFKRAFDNLTPLSCKECWCASFVELNCLFSLKLDTIFNITKLV